MLVTSCAPSPASVFDDFIDAVQRRDLDAALSFYADDFVMQSPDGHFHATREWMPLILEWDFAAGTEVEVREKRVSGDTVFVVVRETNPFLEMTGMGPQVIRSRYLVRENQFTNQRFELLEGHLEMRRAIMPVVKWAKVNDRDALEEVYPEGKFIYNGEAVVKWIALLERWRAATAETDSAT